MAATEWSSALHMPNPVLLIDEPPASDGLPNFLVCFLHHTLPMATDFTPWPYLLHQEFSPTSSRTIASLVHLPRVSSTSAPHACSS